MLVYIIVLVVASTATADWQPGMVLPELDPPYCALRYRQLCKGKGKHVACQFPTQGPGESCVNYTLIKFPKDLRHFVTHYINRRRQRLAMGNERVRGGAHLPRPQAMMQVEWDRELALLAQRLADQCSFVHDECRATVRFPYAGQTVGEVKWRRTSESDSLNVARAVRRVLDAWWGERRRVTAKQLTQPFRLTNRGNTWGHFSQLAVWTLRAVGCGAVRHGNKYPKILLVCDFSHTNMLGQRTLVPGPLGPCPIHTARQRSPYPALCASVRHQETEGTADDHQLKDYETNYDDDGENKNYEEEGSDNFIFDNNTTVHEANEFTLPTEKQKLQTYKRIRIQPLDESGPGKTHDPETEGNDISFDSINKEKSKIANQDFENDPPEEEELETNTKEHFYEIKKMRYRMKPSEKIMQEDGSAIGQYSDSKTPSFQIKRLRDRGKSQEKSNDQESINSSEHTDNERDNELRKVNEKEGIKGEDLESERNVDIEIFEDGTTKNYKIKRIHDKDKGHDEDITQAPVRKRIFQHEDLPKRKEIFEQVRPFGREHLSVTDRIPERELFSLKKIPDRIRNFEPLNPPRKELIPERVRIPNRVPNRREPSESKRQPKPAEERALDRVRPLERVMQRPPEKDAPLDFEPAAENRKPETNNFRGADELASRRGPTTEKQRTRYMVKLSDIQKQQKNFDLKSARKGGLNRQKEFRRIQENQMDKLNLELAQENYKDSLLEPTNKFNRLQPAYAANKHRITNNNGYETPKEILDGFKTLTTTPEPRRTQFYEPVGLRHRWRPSKERPERPGARALITNAYMYTSTRPLAPKKHSATLASINMDKDDVEQLFKDTGFNPNWKQYKKILS